MANATVKKAAKKQASVDYSKMTDQELEAAAANSNRVKNHPRSKPDTVKKHQAILDAIEAEQKKDSRNKPAPKSKPKPRPKKPAGNKTLEEQIAEKEEQIKNNKEEQAKTIKAISDLEEEEKKLKKQKQDKEKEKAKNAAALQKQIEQQQQELERFKNEKEQPKGRTQEKKKANADAAALWIKHTNSELRKLKRQLTNSNNKFDKEISEKQNSLDNLDLDTLKDKKQNLEQESKTLKTELDKLKQTNKSYNKMGANKAGYIRPLLTGAGTSVLLGGGIKLATAVGIGMTTKLLAGTAFATFGVAALPYAAVVTPIVLAGASGYVVSRGLSLIYKSDETPKTKHSNALRSAAVAMVTMGVIDNFDFIKDLGVTIADKLGWTDPAQERVEEKPEERVEENLQERVEEKPEENPQEGVAEEITALTNELADLNADIIAEREALTEAQNNLRGTYENLERALERAEQEKIARIEALNELNALKDPNATPIEYDPEPYQDALKALQEKQQALAEELTNSYEERINAINAANEEPPQNIEELRERVAEAKQSLTEVKRDLAETNQKIGGENVIMAQLEQRYLEDEANRENIQEELEQLRAEKEEAARIAAEEEAARIAAEEEAARKAAEEAAYDPTAAITLETSFYEAIDKLQDGIAGNDKEAMLALVEYFGTEKLDAEDIAKVNAMDANSFIDLVKVVDGIEFAQGTENGLKSLTGEEVKQLFSTLVEGDKIDNPDTWDREWVAKNRIAGAKSAIGAFLK